MLDPMPFQHMQRTPMIEEKTAKRKNRVRRERLNKDCHEVCAGFVRLFAPSRRQHQRKELADTAQKPLRARRDNAPCIVDGRACAFVQITTSKSWNTCG